MFSLLLKELIFDFYFKVTSEQRIRFSFYPLTLKAESISYRIAVFEETLFKLSVTLLNVGNHVSFVRIHCTERWHRFAPDRILSKGKQHFLSVFSIFIQRVIYHFPAHIYPDLIIPGYCQKDPYFQQSHKIGCGEDRD